MPNINRAEITYGMELECVRPTPAAEEILSRRNWLSRHDGSVLGPSGEPLPQSREFITTPQKILVSCGQDGTNMDIDWNGIEQIVSDLANCAQDVNMTCGFHLHLGRPGKVESSWGGMKSDWGPERVRTMLVIGSILENRMYELCPDSRRKSAYCVPIVQAYTLNELGTYYPMGATVSDNKYECHKRKCWLNLVETRRKGTDRRLLRGLSEGLGTIEIRMLGNVRRADYILSWVKLWLKIAAYVAYVPSSLAILHCTAAGSIEADFEAVRQAKANGFSKTTASRRVVSARMRHDAINDDES